MANVGGSAGYWSVFFIFILGGGFAGVVQGCIYSENAKLPS